MNFIFNEEAQDFIYFLSQAHEVRLVGIAVVALLLGGFVRFSAKREHKPWANLKVKLNKIAPFCFVLQGFVLLFFVLKLFVPVTTIQIPFSAFGTIEADFYSVGDGYLLFENHEGLTPETSVFSQEYKIPPGAYDVTVVYDSVEIEQQKGYLYNSTGWLSLYSLGDKRVVTFDALKLQDGSTTLSSYLWTGDFFPVDDFVAEVSYSGYGTLKVEEITLKESFWYRFVVLFKYLFLFALMDFVYYYFIKKEKALCREGCHCVALLGCVVLVSFPLSVDVIYYGDDLGFHLSRIALLTNELHNGQFPVRMFTTGLNGYSYANPLFYCDIFLYFPALLYQMVVPLAVSYKIYVLSIHVLTALIGYFCFSTMAKDRNIGFVVAVLYTTSHYRLICTYHRVAVGEFTAMAFFPLVALGIWLIYTEEKPNFKHWCYLTFGMSGVVSSHIISLQLSVIVLFIFCLVFWKKTFEKQRFLSLVKATLTTICLCFWFIVPFLDSYRMSIQIKDHTAFDIRESGIPLVTMIVDAIFPVGWSLTAGLPLFIVLISGCVLLWKRKTVGESLHEADSDLDNLYWLLKITLISSMITLFFCLDIFPLNEIFDLFGEGVEKFFGKIQFLWRWLAICTVFSSLTALVLLLIAKTEYAGYFRKFVGLLLVTAICSSSIYVISYGINGISFTIRSVATLGELSQENVGCGEYLLEGLELEAYGYSSASATDERVLLDYEKVEGVGYMTVENPTNTAQEVAFPVINYDNYQVMDESGEVYSIYPFEESGYSMVTVEVPSGFSGTLILEYVAPFYWRVAELVSLLTFLWVCFLMKKNGMMPHIRLKKTS